MKPAYSVPAFTGVLVLGLSVVGELSMQLYVPALSAVAQALDGGSVVAAQRSLWVFLLGFGVGQLVVGPASDRLGRRPVVIAGLLLYLAATLAALMAESMFAFTIARLLQAFGACAGFVTARAIVRDLYPLERVPAVFATMTLMIALSVAVAPTVGGWLTGLWEWRASFVLLAGLGGLLLLAVVFLLKESVPERGSSAPGVRNLAVAYVHVLRAPAFLRYVLPLSLVYGTMMAYVCAAPFVVKDLLAVSAQQLGLIFGAILSGFIIGIVLSRLVVARLGVDRLLRVGVSLVLLFAVVTLAAFFIWGYDVRSVVLPQFLLTLGAGFILPNAVAGAITPYGARAGLAAALVGFLQMATGAGFGIVVGLAHDGTPGPMMTLQLAGALLLCLVYGAFEGRRQARYKAQENLV